MNIPKQYLPVMPYLIVEDSAAFLEFAKTVFSANEQLIARDENGAIQHGELTIGTAVIMFAGATSEWKEKTAAMYLHVEDVDSIYTRAMETGASSLYPPVQKDYGYTAGFEDPFRNHWYIVRA